MADIHPHAVRGSFVRVSSDAIRNNAASLVALAGDAALMAVVKADGYGHGAVTAATAAIEGGASWLGVALVSEGVMLRHAGIEVPILVLSEPAEAAMRLAAAHDLDVTVASPAGVSAAISAGDAHHATLGPLRVHLKVDTGMSRMGCSPSSAVELARALRAARGVDHIGLFTHLACADSDDVTSAERQLSRFESLLAELRALDLVPSVVHASNSAGTLIDELRIGRSLHQGRRRCFLWAPVRGGSRDAGGDGPFGVRGWRAESPWCSGRIGAHLWWAPSDARCGDHGPAHGRHLRWAGCSRRR